MWQLKQMFAIALRKAGQCHVPEVRLVLMKSMT